MILLTAEGFAPVPLSLGFTLKEWIDAPTVSGRSPASGKATGSQTFTRNSAAPSTWPGTSWRSMHNAIKLQARGGRPHYVGQAQTPRTNLSHRTRRHCAAGAAKAKDGCAGGASHAGTDILQPVPPAVWTARLILTGHVEPLSLIPTNQSVSETLVMNDRTVIDRKNL